MIIMVPINDLGCRIGQHHPRSTIPDVLVFQMRELRDLGWTYPEIADHVGHPVCTVSKICRYERRSQTAYRYKRIVVMDA